MSKKKSGWLRTLATRSVIAVLPVVIVSAYASGLFMMPTRLAAYDVNPVAEITASSTTVGISASSLYGQSMEDIEAQLDEMLAIGVTTIRVYVPWGLVEQAEDSYDWSYLDDIINAAAERNMGVLAEVNSTPLWAAADEDASAFPVGAATPDTDEFVDFISELVTRYGDVVSAYEIWNEPNYVVFSNPIDPEAYAELLKAVYPVIKELDPTATVVAGAVGATQTYEGLTMSPVEYVERMLAAGAGDYFDALSVHPYGEEVEYSGSCPTCAESVLTPREQVEAIMELLDDKKVWITEYGIPTDGTFTEAEQAAWIKDLLDYWQTYDEDSVGPIFLYTGRDLEEGSTDPEDNYGLWDVNGVLKEAAEMLEDWIAAHTEDPEDPEDPVDPEDPDNPTNDNPIAQVLAAVGQLIQQAVTQAQAFVQAIAQAVVQAISNIVSGITGAVSSITATSEVTTGSGSDDVTQAARTAPDTQVSASASETTAASDADDRSAAEQAEASEQAETARVATAQVGESEDVTTVPADVVSPVVDESTTAGEATTADEATTVDEAATAGEQPRNDELTAAKPESPAAEKSSSASAAPSKPSQRSGPHDGSGANRSNGDQPSAAATSESDGGSEE